MKTYLDIYYTEDHSRSRMIDLFVPEGACRATVMWMHGGGLEAGDRKGMDGIARQLCAEGVGLASVEYGLMPDVSYPTFIEDCATAARWLVDNGPRYGLSRTIAIGGSSAGAYLSMMLCFDRHYLEAQGLKPEDFLGYIFDAGQPTTHFNILKYRGLDQRLCRVDEAAPLYHVKDARPNRPLFIICADHDMPARLQQNQLLKATLEHFGYDMNAVRTKLMQGYEHCGYDGSLSGGRYILGDLIGGFVEDALSHRDGVVTLFTSGEGAHSYRIPTIITLKSGKTLVFCEARRNSLSDSGSIDIVMRAGRGLSFSPARTVVSGQGNTAGNPCPIQDPATGRLFLLYNGNDADRPEPMILKGQGPRTCHVIWSDDEGETWSAPRDITASVKKENWTWYAFGPCHGAVTRDGRLLMGANHAVLDPNKGVSGPYFSHIVYSDDHGETWHIGPELGEGTNESSIAAYADGSLLVNMRHIQPHGGEEEHCRAQAWSSDGGRTFGETVFQRELVDPVCQGSVLTVMTDRGEETLMTNAASLARERVAVHRSADRGRTWRLERVIEPGPSAYSDIARMSDGSIGVVCEAGDETPYERIDLHVFRLTV